ncbi:uncharacterized protein CLUP02_07073 [Colletotrichum lupini]|uniref:Uncharacterized protein n=1 Tax=Colletotrichum lupini TaxID=145971 RepID=A0A9Q8SS50_9PEZI|nr:uncharacterized protein CLUP02_07073 [Colletotrichum lupini]UQC81587.1 hypothetical protein CLUP02_07073 [Colletotrichum lupini]
MESNILQTFEYSDDVREGKIGVSIRPVNAPKLPAIAPTPLDPPLGNRFGIADGNSEDAENHVNPMRPFSVGIAIGCAGSNKDNADWAISEITGAERVDFTFPLNHLTSCAPVLLNRLAPATAPVDPGPVATSRVPNDVPRMPALELLEVV